MKSFPLLKILLALCFAMMFHGEAFSQTNIPAKNPLIIALKEGVGFAPLPTTNKMYAVAAEQMKTMTGSTGDVTLAAFRVTRFIHQPNCGRVAFGLYQESTKKLWGQVGGQVNICEDGSPPQRICANDPLKLVSYDAVCSDRSRPVDTPEVTAAIAAAIKKGSMSTEDTMKHLDPKSGGAK